MKKILIVLAVFTLSLNCFGQEENSRFSIPIKNWNMKLIGMDNFFPTYLADPLAVRFEASTQNISYSDFEHHDKINEGGDYKGRVVLIPGGRFSIFKFSPGNNPNLGIELEIGGATPVPMRQGNFDLIGTDGIYYFAIAAKPTEWLALRFSKHHICTHLGDEFVSGITDTPTDYDPNITQLPVRDDFILSAAAQPLYFLGKPEWNILRVYGDFGFFLPGVDFLGTRLNKPNRTAYLNFQAGAELEYYFKKEYLGGLYSALNVSAYQPNAFSPNISFTAGYIFPQERFRKRARFGIHLYNGRSLLNQFYNKKEKFMAFYLSVDF